MRAEARGDSVWLHIYPMLSFSCLLRQDLAVKEGFTVTKSLGQGKFGAVIMVCTPKGEEVHVVSAVTVVPSP